MLGVEAGINSQPFAIFVTPKQRKMNKIKREERENLHTFLDTTSSLPLYGY